jgi:hypothetical protein
MNMTCRKRMISRRNKHPISQIRCMGQPLWLSACRYVRFLLNYYVWFIGPYRSEWFTAESGCYALSVFTGSFLLREYGSRWACFVVQKDPSLSRSGYNFKSVEIHFREMQLFLLHAWAYFFLPILVIHFGHNLIVELSEMRIYWFWRRQNLCMQFVSFL